MKKTKNVYVYDESGRPQRQSTTNSLAPDQTLYTVGTNGDFETLNECFTYLRNFYTTKNKTEIRMLSGFYIEEQLEFDGEDLRNVRLTSEDEEVLISREYMLSTNTGTSNYFVKASATHLFSLGTQLRMDETGTPGGSNVSNYNGGFTLRDGCKFTIESSNIAGKSCGISNFMASAIFSVNSDVLIDYQGFVNGSASSGDFSFSGGAAVWGSNISGSFGSKIIVSGAECKDSAHSNIRITNGANGYIQQSTCTGAGQYGLYVSAATAQTLNSLFQKGETDSSEDIFCESSAIIQVDNDISPGGFNKSINTIDADGLIISPTF